MPRNRRTAVSLENDPLWYKDAIIYEVHVRAFYDSTGDGIGDFAGLEQKLDYLQDLGITALWLLPFCPSPWRDDGYDISDYTDVHPAYGTLRDFQSFLRQAHRRGLRVITELVINHTSDQHAWFKRARLAPPGSRWRDFYVWSDTPDRYSDARIIFKDTETSNWAWDPVAKAYYWHRFFSHQPDLNFANPSVRKAVLDVLDFWLDMGVDGLRLDAVPYLFERDGTDCENLPETHAFLKELRRHMDSRYEGRMLIAEANQWPEDAVAYFGCGDESNMNFHFPVMPRLFMATRMEDRFPLVDILRQTPAIPENCQWAMFLRNHDELTLEMVTDEERDYMYRVYASDPQMRINLGIRRRLSALMNYDRRRIELMNALLCSLPGTPVIYYGDEIGMGDNVYLGDRNGVRTPMQWSGDRNAGFSRANPQRLYLPVIIDPAAHYEAINVEAQQNNPSSLLWWMKRLFALRKQYKAFGRGSIEFLHPENRKVLAFVRRYEDEVILVIANLSRFVQPADLDLTAFRDMTPVEMFGRAEFPAITASPCHLTLGPHGFYWFVFEPRRAAIDIVTEMPVETRVPVVAVDSWDNLFAGRSRAAIEKALPAFLVQRRWFRGKDERIRAVHIADVVPLEQAAAYILLVSVDYTDADTETYQIPLTLARGGAPVAAPAESVLVRLTGPGGEEGILYGSLWDVEFGRELLDAIARRRRYRGDAGEIVATSAPALRRSGGVAGDSEPSISRGGSSNSTLCYGDRFVLKLFRKLEPGVNPELEIGRFLTDRKFPNAPAVAGSLEYRAGGESMTAGVLQTGVPHQGDALAFTRDHLSAYYEAALTRRRRDAHVPELDALSLSTLEQDPPPIARDLIGTYFEAARLMGRRTAELHLALSEPTDDPRFAAEPFTDFYRQGLYHGCVGQLSASIAALRRYSRLLAEPVLSEVRRVIGMEDEIKKRFEAIRERRVQAVRIRIHGDLHLGELLYTGRDFVFIDFEGPTHRPLSERRIKRSPLRDVAGMLRSFHYMSHGVLHGQIPGVSTQPEHLPALEAWGRFWNRWVGVVFLREYLATASGAAFLPRSLDQTAFLLYIYLLDKAVQEVGYEIRNRPEWLRVPLESILNLMNARWA